MPEDKKNPEASSKKELKESLGKESEELSPEQKITFGEKSFEKREKHFLEKKFAREALTREVQLMEMDENFKKEAEKKAKEIQYLAEEDKIEHLLRIAKEKGVVLAVASATNMNDPFTLDMLHDILAKEWDTYKQYLK